jgi:SNF2 family DNA or RNA helicase
MRLQNLVMQLRKISSHPFLFDWPVDPQTGNYVVNEDLVNASGKMLLLNRLLDALIDRGHKVLLFSQFTTMLDIIVSSTRKEAVGGVDAPRRRIGRRATRASRSAGLMGARRRSRGGNR